jgi:hypothetical protein
MVTTNQTWLLTPEERAQRFEAALLLAQQRIAQLEADVAQLRQQLDDLLRTRNPGT